MNHLKILSTNSLFCQSSRLRKCLLLLKSFKYKLTNKYENKIYFIHIPKTGGVYVENILSSINKQKNIFFCPGHFFKPFFLKKKRNEYFIIIRDPTKWMISAFYAIKNLKKNKSYLEEKIFKKYPEFNDLLEDLYSNGKRNVTAKQAFNNLYVLNEGYRFFFIKKIFEKNKPIYIIEQENLNYELNIFLEKFNFNISSFKEVFRNSGNYNREYRLSDRAIKNLKTFVSEEYDIYDYLIKQKKIINMNFVKHYITIKHNY